MMKGKQPFWLYAAVLLPLLVGVFAAASLKPYDRARFALSAAFLCVAAMTAVISVVLYRRSNLRYLATLSEEVTATERESLYLLPAPTVIISDDGMILWYNKYFFERILNGKELFGKSLETIVDIELEHLLRTGEETIQFYDRTYQVGVTSAKRAESALYTLCFTDVTDFVTLKETFENTRPCVLLILIDNYDDVLQDAKESEKAVVYAAIETMFEKFMENSTGLIRRLSSELFMAVVEEQHLQDIMRGKFKILDEARTIQVGERSSITLSVGVGHGGATLAESEQFAKQALDMALGRGGDQAAVKTENGFKFFGGVSKGVEKKSRAKTRIIANALQELINVADNVLIMGHRFGDLDSIGSATGLAGAIRKLGVDANVVVNREQVLANVLIDYAQEQAAGLFVDIPTALQRCNDRTLLIIVDTHNRDFIESVDLYQKAKTVVVIDHHRKSVNFIDNAVIFYHEPYASSASELVTELIQHFKLREQLPVLYAEALLAGIMLDTKNFVMRTGVRTFEAAAYLRKLGADTVQVKKFFSNSIETYQHRSMLVSAAEVYHGCAIAVAEQEVADISLIAPQAADDLLGITGVAASFVVFRKGGAVHISARSMGAMNVQVIMERLGGGGHQTMAATQLQDTTVAEAKEQLFAAIRED